MNGYLFSGLMIVILAAASVLRLADLSNRPMHCDEANHAIKFGHLLEDHEYKYNPYEYHGPTLNYLTLPVAWLSGTARLVDVTETQLRLVPAIFGIVLVGLVWLLRRELGDAATLTAAALSAVSPAMVFYSRYYVQEALLVCFSFGAIVAWFRFVHASGVDESGAAHRRLKPVLWLMAMGVCLGLMHASKETCVIAMFAMAFAALALVGDWWRMGVWRLAVAALIVLVSAAAVSALFFSSFGRHPQGIVDSLTAFTHYLGRAAGEGSAGEHVHAWTYYFRILFWWHKPGGPLWTEGLIALLAIVGFVAGAWGKGLTAAQVGVARFLGIYTVIVMLVYTLLPYKTPWCALGFLHGLILLAGIGAVVLVRAMPGYVLKGAVIFVLVAAGEQLAFQAAWASFKDCEDRNNPYVYSHTTNEVVPFVDRIRQIASADPDGKPVHIQVICPDDDYWPLPWYMRDFRHVGWFSGEPRGPDDQILPAAPLIIAQPKMREMILEYNYRKQPPGRRHVMIELPPKADGRQWQFRPYVPITAYVRLKLWDAYRAEEKQIPEHSRP